jgi:hypothetical protein
LLSFLELLEAGDRPVEFAFEGSGVAEDEGEAAFRVFGRLVGNEVDVEVFRLGFAGAIEAPHAAGDLVDDLDLKSFVGGVLVDEAGYERFEFRSILSGQDDVAAGQAVLQRIRGRARFAFLRARAGPANHFDFGLRMHRDLPSLPVFHSRKSEHA